MKFNAGFLHPADDRAVHLNFGGWGEFAEDEAGDSDLRNMYALFSLINPNKIRS